jgi:hypothetical protein
MSSCPSIYELTGSSVLPPQLASHVDGCPRCRALREAWDGDDVIDERLDADSFPDVEWPHSANNDIDAGPAPGALHAMWGPETGELLIAAILEVDHREALVIPLSPEIRFAGEWDVSLNGQMPYQAMLEVWNHSRVLREQIMEQIGQLTDGLVVLLNQAFKAFTSSGELPPGLSQGPKLLTEQDPRHRFREAETGRVRMFSEPWRVLFATQTFGGVVRIRREEYELDLAELSQDVDLSQSSLGRMEQGVEDLVAQVARTKLERLIKRLRLPASVRLHELIHQAAFDNAREPPPQLKLARARRRRGVRTGRPALPQELRQAMADQYVHGLLERLGEDS